MFHLSWNLVTSDWRRRCCSHKFTLCSLCCCCCCCWFHLMSDYPSILWKNGNVSKFIQQENQFQRQLKFTLICPRMVSRAGLPKCCWLTWWRPTSYQCSTTSGHVISSNAIDKIHWIVERVHNARHQNTWPSILPSHKNKNCLPGELRILLHCPNSKESIKTKWRACYVI